VRVLGAFFVVIGVLLIGLRVAEHVAGGFVGEVSVLAIGLVSFAVGAAILWRQAKHPTVRTPTPLHELGRPNNY